MKLTGLLLGILVSTLQMAWAQTHESEPIDKFRKTYDFKMPDVGKAENGSTPVVVVETRDGTPGLHYTLDGGVQRLLDIHKRRNDAAEEADGFRIQIYAGSDQNLANEARADFLAKFSQSEMDVHPSWDPPHFRVRVGDFRTRAEAMRELPNVRRIFPDGFVVSDKVKIRKARRNVLVPTPPEENQPVEDDSRIAPRD